MTNKPARVDGLPPLRTDAGHYMQVLLEAGQAAGRITPEQMSRIRQSMDRMLTDMAVRYTFGASGSIPAQTARQLLSSAAYAIGLALRQSTTPDAALDRLLTTPPDELRLDGLTIIDGMLGRARQRVNALQAASVIGNRAYLDTVSHGLPLFFQSYDKVYAAHESPGSIDYPLCVDPDRLTGAQYVDTYIESLLIEAAFLSRWPRKSTDALLRGYSPGWRELLMNVYERALVNALGRVLCGYGADRLDLSADDRAYLSERLSGKPPARVRTLLGIALERLEPDKAGLAYAQRALPDIAASVRAALEAGHPETVFVTPVPPPAPAARFIDGPRMSDDAFRALTETVRKCRHVSDKLALIRRRVKSLEDLADLLDACCLSGDEFAPLFRSLDAVTLKQLAALVPEDPFHATADENEWHAALARHLNKLSHKT